MMIEKEDRQWLNKEDREDLWCLSKKILQEVLQMMRGRGTLPSLGVICERQIEKTLVNTMSDYTNKVVNDLKVRVSKEYW